MDRRGSDKIGPFLRWARSKTKALETNEEKYFAIQALLAPSNVITQHAMSHWEGDCPLNPHRFSRWYYGWSSHDPVYITRELFEKAFREAFETCHKTVNKILKSGGGWSYGKFSTHHRYKDCKAGEDFCVEQWIWRRRVYKYKLPTVGYWSGETTGPKTYRITESDRPTMSYGVKKMLPFDSYIKETPKERHRLSWCQARVLLKHPEDVKKVTDYLFSTYYRFRADGTGVGKRKKSNVFRERDLRNNRGKTVKELVELFKRKGFIE
jgi:hypothetical protein